MAESWMQLSFKEIAMRLQIGVATAHSVYEKYEIGDVAPRCQTVRPDCRKLDQHHELYIIALNHENPAVYLHEIC